MNGWQPALLGNLIDTKKGYAFKSGWYCDTGRRIVKVNSFTEDSIDSKGLICIPEVIAADYMKYELHVGDVILQTVGSWPNNPASVVGKCVRTPRDAAGSLLNQNAVKLSPSKHIYKQFLFYLLKSENFKTYIIGTAQGAANQASITLESIRGYEFDLPPLPIQHRIADILSTYDDLIENNQRRIQILENMARSLYRAWFVEFRFPGHEKVKFVDSPLGKIPEGWEIYTFDRLLTSMGGGDWGSEQSTDVECAEVAVVRGTDFKEVAYGGDLRVPVRYIKLSSLKSRKLRAGDLIVENSINAKSRSVGTPLLVDNAMIKRIGREAIAASFCKLFRFHDPLLAPLALLHLRYLREEKRMEYYQNVATNGIGNFQAQKFAKEERLILPSNVEVRANLVEKITVFTESISVLASKVQNLRQTRDLLLPRLLSGQLDVSTLPEEAIP